ncbi:biotin-dependent carboxyltransferase family protein [Azospirillum thermophilum]|uniref:5-oxoprolinase subunit C family protein n=1 Tax=Azospirillum thermophilum TaxID=2202148 RepID=UPI001B3B591B|nr:biotin-dependent carboxyltransferase family protein [Azospirillum thermophilum]
MMAALLVEAAGPSSTIQDAGRVGYQRFGVSVAGAADPLLHAAANALVGNAPAEGAVEFTLLGDRLVVEAESCLVAVAGDAVVTIDGQPAQPWRSHRLTRGQRLAVGALRSGVRGYLAAAGGFALRPVLGSVATHVRSRLGGLDGRPLGPGDRLPLRLEQAPERIDAALDPAGLPRRGTELRVLPGPQDDAFTAAGLETFFGQPYRIGHEADRMGYRLDGPPIEHARGFNITSDGIPPGAVQVPGTGRPIVLLADRQTTGGYPRSAACWRRIWRRWPRCGRESRSVSAG